MAYGEHYGYDDTEFFEVDLAIWRTIYDVPWFWVLVENPQGETFPLVERIAPYVSKEYNVQLETSEDGSEEKLVFNHSEEVAVPSEAFVGECGEIYFIIRVLNMREEKILDTVRYGVPYKVIGGKVILGEDAREYA